MKTKPIRAPTLGGLIVNLCNTYGTRKAKGILSLMIEARLIMVRGCNRYVLSGGNEKA